MILHLFWDEEWCAPLDSIEPELELTAVRWGIFALKRIIERADETKISHKEIMDNWMSLQIEAFRLGGGEEKERKERIAKEEQGKIANTTSWLNLETEENRSSIDYFLGRCLLVLSVSGKLANGPQRLIHAGGLSLLSSCLDNPIMDIQSASAGGLQNTMGMLGMEHLRPEHFLDPAHVVRSTVLGFHRAAMEGNLSQRSHVFMLLLLRLNERPEWVPYFEQLPPECKMIAGEVTGRVRFAPPSSDGERKAAHLDAQSNVNEKCSNYTAKLRSCHACGKLETKRGDMPKCSKCFQVVYCSKEVSYAIAGFILLLSFRLPPNPCSWSQCQIDDWRKGHKAECKRLRKASAAAVV